MKVWSWRQAILRSSLASTTKLVLLALSTHMNDHGEGCYPSLDTIALETSLTRKAVITHIAKAADAGFLIKDRMNLSGRKWASNEYRAAMPSAMELGTPHNEGVNVIHPISGNDDIQPATGEADTPHDEIRGEPNTLEGCTLFSHGVYDVHTNSPGNSKDNSKNNIPANSQKRKSYPPEFEQFWVVWPSSRRCEKPNAYAAWRETCKQITPDELLAAARRYLLTKEAIDGFAPYPAKWLKRERWLEFEQVPEAAKVMPTLIELGGDTPENRGFSSILQKLRDAHGEAVSRSWFNQLRLTNKNCSALTLRAPTRFVAEWIRTNFADDIQKAASQVWPEITGVLIECNPNGNQRDV